MPAVLGDVESGWCMPCVPYAGPQVGVAFLPEVGSGVWIAFEGGDVSYPIWVGCYWRSGELPSDVAPDVKVIVTTAPLELKLDDGGESITITDSNGNTVTLDSSRDHAVQRRPAGRRRRLERLGQRRRAGGDVMSFVRAPTTPIPLRIDGGSQQAAQSPYAAHVEQMIEQVLLTTPGERVDLPQFGCGLRQLVFAPMHDALDATLKMQVTQALGQWLAGVIEVVDVDVTTSNDDAALDRGTVQVTVVLHARRHADERADDGDAAMSVDPAHDRLQYLLAGETTPTWNGIDYVEIANADQTQLRVHFLNAAPVDGHVHRDAAGDDLRRRDDRLGRRAADRRVDGLVGRRRRPARPRHRGRRARATSRSTR